MRLRHRGRKPRAIATAAGDVRLPSVNFEYPRRVLSQRDMGLRRDNTSTQLSLMVCFGRSCSIEAAIGERGRSLRKLGFC